MSQTGPPGPRAAPPPPVQTEREEKRALQSWWRGFKKSEKRVPEQQALPQGIFGIPLQHSIRYANVAISLLNDEGQSYIYGYVPIVVAKCGVYLKEKATDVEGIFRLAGSEKRIKELKVAFDSPERFGKGLDWTGYTVHDAANILRRYFNQLPEPIIPLDFYDRFRDPIRDHQAQAVGPLDAQAPSVGDFDHTAAIRTYQALITELPPLNRQLLLYILDLLAVFASKSDLNKMTTQNLSAIFQPGILSHPQHDMAPAEYRLSQDVLIFLIDNQDSFLIGMQGTAADSETVREVQSGVPTPSKAPSGPNTPSRAKTVIGRTGSNASAGAESVKKWGSIRRNVSVTSKNSKRSEIGPTPVTPSMSSPSTPSNSGGVHRSNTVPSKRGNTSSQPSPRVSSAKSSDPTTPNATTIATAEAVRAQQDSLQSTPVATSAPQFLKTAANEPTSTSKAPALPLAAGGSESTPVGKNDYQTPKRDTTPLLPPPGGSSERSAERSASNTPSTGQRGFLDIFKQSPGSDSDTRPRNKLRKKQYPGSSLSSAQSSSQSLHDTNAQRSPTTSSFPTAALDEQLKKYSGEQSKYATAQTTPTGLQAPQSPPQRSTTDATLKPLSPSPSFHSNTEATDASDADFGGDELPKELPTSPEKGKKRSRWRFSRTQNKLDQESPAQTGTPFGSKENTTSRSTVGSSAFSGSQPRRSFQEPTPLTPSATDPSSNSPQQAAGGTGITPSNTDPAVFSDSEREKRGPMSWIRGKIQERKEKEDAKRSSTPERHGHHGRRGGSRQDLSAPGEGLPVRGRSFEGQRQGSALAPAPSSTGEGSRTPTGPPSDAQAASMPAHYGWTSATTEQPQFSSASATDQQPALAASAVQTSPPGGAHAAGGGSGIDGPYASAQPQRPGETTTPPITATADEAATPTPASVTTMMGSDVDRPPLETDPASTSTFEAGVRQDVPQGERTPQQIQGQAQPQASTQQVPAEPPRQTAPQT